MARISKYTFDSQVTVDDFVIGSDAVSKRTKNYKVGDLARFFGQNQYVLGNKFAYIYDQSSVYKDLSSGEISFANNFQTNTKFESISRIYMNPVNLAGVNVSEFLGVVQNYGLLKLVNGFDATSFGVYRIQEIDPIQNGVLELVVDLQLGNGTLTDQDTVVISSNGKSDLTYTTPELSGSIWQINHGLSKYPSVTVVDTADNVIYAEVQYVDKNNLTITFAYPVTGKAHLN
jgi:hypothetical protein